MKLTLKKSSSICEAHYDAKTAQLDITFYSGSTYRYYQVTEDVVDLWERASKTPKGSTGHYFYFFIRMNFKYENLEGDRENEVECNTTTSTP